MEGCGDSAEEAGKGGYDSTGWCAYVLGSGTSNRTYVGMTNNLSKRIRQHNGSLSGGARRTRTGRPWEIIAVVAGFGSMSHAMQAEWRIKRTRSIAKAVSSSDRWTSSAPAFTEQVLRIYAAPSGRMAVPPEILPDRWALRGIGELRVGGEGGR